jgi:hypothetical protein
LFTKLYENFKISFAIHFVALPFSASFEKNESSWSFRWSKNESGFRFQVVSCWRRRNVGGKSRKSGWEVENSFKSGRKFQVFLKISVKFEQTSTAIPSLTSMFFKRLSPDRHQNMCKTLIVFLFLLFVVLSFVLYFYFPLFRDIDLKNLKAGKKKETRRS